MERSFEELNFHSLADMYLKETVTAARNEICAMRAQREGRAQEACLFKAMALAQRVHANKALMLLRGKASPVESGLESSLQILEENIERYKVILSDVDGPVKSFADQFLRTAKNHLSLIRQHDEGKETAFFVCQICGFISASKVPNRCPVCQAIPEKFEEVR